MNHFIFPYYGNKRKEYKLFKDNIDFLNKKIIIEPFAGSCAISFQIFKERGNQYTFYLNDINKMVYKIYELYKKHDAEYIENNINIKLDQMRTKGDYDKLKKEELNCEEPNLWTYIVINKYHAIRPGIFPYKTDMTKAKFKFTDEQIKFLNFMKMPNVIISNDDWSILFEKFKSIKKCIFFMDPPYLVSCNEYYQLEKIEKKQNIYEYFALNKTKKNNSSIYFIIEKNWIINLLFSEKKCFEYDKTYEASKKKTKHILIKW